MLSSEHDTSATNVITATTLIHIIISLSISFSLYKNRNFIREEKKEVWEKRIRYPPKETDEKLKQGYKK